MTLLPVALAAIAGYALRWLTEPPRQVLRVSIPDPADSVQPADPVTLHNQPPWAKPARTVPDERTGLVPDPIRRSAQSADAPLGGT